jgi:tetratricopeptide (TPR) repeat protein
LRWPAALGNLRLMNKWRVGGVIVLAVLAVLAVLLTLRSCAPGKEPATAGPIPPREEFHASKPLRILIKTEDAASAAWLNRELRNLLLRGRMRLATDEPQKTAPFTLQVAIAQGSQARANVALLAPDGVTERSMEVELHPDSRLSTMQNFARQLPDFLRATRNLADWITFPGTQDAPAYESFLLSSGELFDSTGAGFTQPPAAAALSHTVDRLETLTRTQPGFARAWALLAIAYLSLGGEDEASLTQIAESTAQRALTLDATLADAQSALGLVSLRRGEWVTATEHFDAALALDANALPALEGSACLLMDVGKATAALPIASHAVELQPGNVGAHECLVYAQLATGQPATDKAHAGQDPHTGNDAPDVARVKAMAAILSGNLDHAQQALQGAGHATNADAWTEPLLRAAADKHKTSDALQAITLAASDRSIDPATEILSGTALRQSEFVFNRMLRLHKQKQSVPLRILWLPQTDFLRRHPRFEQIVNAEGLLPFWQEHGLPDVCSGEPDIYGCKLRSPAAGKGKEPP